jgi:hypothetical protein
MPKPAVDILLTFPPRPLSPTEQVLVQEWMGLANDVPFAYEPTATVHWHSASSLRISQTAAASMPLRPMHRRAEAPYLSLMDERLRYASIGCAVCVAASPWVWLALFLYGHG